MSSSDLTVRTATPAEHLAHLGSRRSASFLQTPAWAAVKNEWRHESLLWERDGAPVGAGLVLYRDLPRLKRSLAYLPEGPVLDWTDDAEESPGLSLGAWLDPMVAHLKRQGAFGIRIGPPVVVRRWDAAAVKAGVADPDVHRLGELAPTARESTGARVVSQLHELGWRPQGLEEGFAAGQPRFVFQVPLRHPDGTPRTEDEVLKGMNQLWRRNIKKADKAGVVVTRATAADVAPQLAEFHALYVHTAERDGFTPRPASYFTRMVDALSAEDPDRIALWTARHDGDLVASTIAIRVGAHAWYSYGASSTEKRDVRGSNAVQWAMVRDAIDAGADVYDLRGITETLDADDTHVGLIQFKAGTGGEAVEYAGEWDLPVNRVLYKAFETYMGRRR
ncbi:peptidoglycan bridge formation glycyltransferase FemA/FemB family protein [Nocardioides sp. CFH 31398]|uniref:lipid II:glycine glycyltransferase FemX n=1 Tax=Nocardioides sp. CFH 31398 TaxID=2919579 RepID=UPI001F052AEB|nr:peptidoglycan bridge formation glycyltransferase FemA/FemB family protein [Nocardioides sp. CFH 31398]MCH1865723.1 aminoacyltransferase [Nocardioides sp. CFH 31398]